MPTIFVSRNGNSKNLKLRNSEENKPGDDDLTTMVGPGAIITWSLDNNSGLTSLHGILKLNPNDPKYDPKSVKLLEMVINIDGNYTGIIVSPSPGKGKYEKYKIGFMIPGDLTIYWDDPKIEMNT